MNTNRTQYQFTLEEIKTIIIEISSIDLNENGNKFIDGGQRLKSYVPVILKELHNIANQYNIISKFKKGESLIEIKDTHFFQSMCKVLEYIIENEEINED